MRAAGNIQQQSVRRIDHGRTELTGEQVLTAQALGVSIDVVTAGHRVGGGQVFGPRGRSTDRPGLLDRLAGRSRGSC